MGPVCNPVAHLKRCGMARRIHLAYGPLQLCQCVDRKGDASSIPELDYYIFICLITSFVNRALNNNKKLKVFTFIVRTASHNCILVPWSIIRVRISINLVKIHPILAFDGDFFVLVCVSSNGWWRLFGAFTDTFMHCNTIRSKTPLTVVAWYHIGLCCLPLCFLQLLSV